MVWMLILAPPVSAAAATRYLKSTNSDCTNGTNFTKLADFSTAAAVTLTVAVAKNSTEDDYAISAILDPNDNAWDMGDWAVTVRITGASGTGVSIACGIIRFDSSCSQQEASTVTAFQLASAGVKSFSLPGLAWTGGNYGDRIGILYRWKCGSTARSVTIQMNTVDQAVSGPLVQNGTHTATGTFTNTPTFTWTPTATPTFTWTPTATPTWTPTWTSTNTPTHTPTWTKTATPTGSPTSTSTPTATWTPTDSPTRTSTSTPTGTYTNSPTPTPTGTPTPTVTPTATPTVSTTVTPYVLVYSAN